MARKPEAILDECAEMLNTAFHPPRADWEAPVQGHGDVPKMLRGVLDERAQVLEALDVIASGLRSARKVRL